LGPSGERKVDQQSPHKQREKIEESHQIQIEFAEIVFHYCDSFGLGAERLTALWTRSAEA